MSVPTDTLHDLTDAENIKDAARAFHRAEMSGGDAALARWAREWGRSAIDALRDADFDGLELDD